MDDLRTLVRDEMARAGSPSYSFNDLGRRRDRKRRNHRIAAGVVGITVFVAAIWIVRDVALFDRSETPAVPGPTVIEPGPNGPYTQPSYTLGHVKPRDIALGESFIDAWADGDGEAAAAMFAPEGTFEGFQPAILPALHDWFRAEGCTFRAEGCDLHGWGPERGAVGCGLTYENDLTRALGILPVGTTISFLAGADGIETAWYGSGGDLVFDMFAGYRGRDDVLGPVWDTFIDWIASNHPDDVVRIYDPDHSYPVLDAASIELWKRYTAEFLASPEAQALARSIRDAGWDGVGIPPEGTAPSTPAEGELIAGYFKFHVGFVFVYADGRVISQRAIASSGSGMTNEQLLTPEGVELVRSGAVRAKDFLYELLVPADAWEDAEARLYVPSRYAFCFGGTMRFLPARAREILTGKEHTYGSGEDTIECSEVTTDEARDLSDILYGQRFGPEVHMLLPHGEWEPKVDG